MVHLCIVKHNYYGNYEDVKQLKFKRTNQTIHGAIDHHSNRHCSFTRIEALYHLVYMIYLDRVVEDLELEVAADYAVKLGFEKELVGDLFKSIATIPYDEVSPQDLQKEVEDFIKIQNG